MPVYIFDTNAIRYLVNPTFTSAAQRARLQERGRAGDLAVKYTPIANTELASQIEEDPTKFIEIRDAVRVLLDMEVDVLPDFELRMLEIVSDLHGLPRTMYGFWHDMMVCIAKAPDAASLQKGFDDYTTATHRAVYVDFLARFRERYEAQYRDAWRSVLRGIVPDFDNKVAAGTTIRLEKSEIAALETFLASPEWHVTVLSILAFRGKTSLPRKSYEIAAILDKARYFREGFEWLIRKSAVDGLRPFTEKRKNDYNDIHLLLYINDYADTVIVSEDTEFMKKVSCAGTKVISYKAFVAREAPV